MTRGTASQVRAQLNVEIVALCDAIKGATNKPLGRPTDWSGIQPLARTVALLKEARSCL